MVKYLIDVNLPNRFSIWASEEYEYVISINRVIHMKIRNMKMNAFHQIISNIWGDVCAMSEEYKLIRVYPNKIEGID
jgi:hypothetical protein